MGENETFFEVYIQIKIILCVHRMVCLGKDSNSCCRYSNILCTLLVNHTNVVGVCGTPCNVCFHDTSQENLF